jgi:trehalose 6-phosphate synthase
MSAKLIVVSNREPYLVRRRPEGEVRLEPNPDGLWVALDPLLRSRGGVWISWSGIEREDRKGEPRMPEWAEVTAEYRLRRIPLSEREASLYLYGFANRALWPVCHQFLGRVDCDPEGYRAYRRVNQRFADAVVEQAGPGACVWVHDYPLALVPGMVRAVRPDVRIALSWHLPWPPVESWRTLPWARELLSAVLSADVINLPLARYARHLGAAARELAGAELREETGGELTIASQHHDAQVVIGPLGVDEVAIAARARAARGGRVIRLRRGLCAERLALSIDALDGTRGVLERVAAVGQFFERYPSYRGRLVMCQIAIPSHSRAASYREFKRALDEQVDKVNARFQRDAWKPIQYFYRGFDPEELSVYYAAADVLFDTPLAGGVGHHALEYVASRLEGDGALMVSELAGTPDVFPEAFFCNPYSSEQVSATLRGALETPARDLSARMRALRERVADLAAAKWRDGVLERTRGATQLSATPIPELPARDATASL